MGLRTDKGALKMLGMYCIIPCQDCGIRFEIYEERLAAFRFAFHLVTGELKYQQDIHKLFQEILSSRGLLSRVQISGKQLTMSLVQLMQNTLAFTL